MESGANPELPPQLYVRTKWDGHWRQELFGAPLGRPQSRTMHESGDLPCLERFMFFGV